MDLRSRRRTAAGLMTLEMKTDSQTEGPAYGSPPSVAGPKSTARPDLPVDMELPSGADLLLSCSGRHYGSVFDGPHSRFSCNGE